MVFYHSVEIPDLLIQMPLLVCDPSFLVFRFFSRLLHFSSSLYAVFSFSKFHLAVQSVVLKVRPVFPFVDWYITSRLKMKTHWRESKLINIVWLEGEERSNDETPRSPRSFVPWSSLKVVPNILNIFNMKWKAKRTESSRTCQ